MRPAVIASAALLAGAALVGGVVKSQEGGKSAKAQAAKVATARAAHKAALEALPKKSPNVISVEPDHVHPGYEKVTYKFTPGRDSISFLTETVAPDEDQGHATDRVETYNNGNEVIQYGQELTVDVDTETGYIVPNPDKS